MNKLSTIAEAFGMESHESAGSKGAAEAAKAAGAAKSANTAKSPHKAFIPFITCGDPDLATTRALILKMQAEGADLIELGIPFSDPCAEGPVIQEANIRALAGNICTDEIFSLVESLTCVPAHNTQAAQDTQAATQNTQAAPEVPNTQSTPAATNTPLAPLVHVPLVFMTYANVVFSYGAERFMKRCQEVGIQGIILPDVPFEEREEFLPYCEKHGVALISLIAPTSKDRIEKIARAAQGFVYVVSSMGTTGERSEIRGDLADMLHEIRRFTQIPCAIGFGISTPDQAQKMAAIADGVIVGSAIVKLVGTYGKDAPAVVGSFVKAMKTACLGAHAK